VASVFMFPPGNGPDAERPYRCLGYPFTAGDLCPVLRRPVGELFRGAEQAGLRRIRAWDLQLLGAAVYGLFLRTKRDCVEFAKSFVDDPFYRRV